MHVRHFAALAAGALLLTAGYGCRSVGGPDAPEFNRIAARLQPGGSYYHISSLRYLQISLARFAAEIDAAIAKSELPAASREKLQSLSTAISLAARLAGVDELQGYGASSRALDDKGTVFENRVYLSLPEEPRGFLWHLTGTGNHPLAEDLASLPADTMFAADFELEPLAVWNALKKADKSIAAFDELCRSTLNIPLEKLFAGLSGEWGFLVLADPEFDLDNLKGIHFILTLPDADRTCYGRLALLAQLIPGTTVEDDALTLGPIEQLGPDFRPILTWTEGRITLFSGKEAIDRFSADTKRLADTPEFTRLCDGLPESGAGYIYTGKNYAGILRNIAAALTTGLNIDFTEFQPESLTVFRNDPAGKLAIGRSTWDFNQYEFARLAAIPAMLALAGAENWFHEQRDAADRGQWNAQCAAGLEKIRQALWRYADANGGRFPEGDGIAGFKSLLAGRYLTATDLICPGTEDEAAAQPDEFTFENCSYLYLDGFTRQSALKLPLVIDWPFNHEDRVNVLLVDGSVVSLEIANAENCRRVISFLHTMFRYDEADFKKLIQKANQLDQQFKLE